MAQLTIKQGDTRHAIRAKLKTINGQTDDLTSATVRFKMADISGRLVVDRDATVLPDGVVELVFSETETAVPSIYSIEYEVTYGDYRVETFPHTGSIRLYIEKRIGGI